MYLKDSCEGAPSGLLVAVERQAGDEDEHAEERDERGQHEAEVPALAVLHPHHEDQAHESAQRDAEGVPVEEAGLAAELPGVVAVELVAAQRRRADTHGALADRDHVQAQRQQAQVPAAHRRALARVVHDVARWRVQRRKVSLACQQHVAQNLDGCEDEDGVEALDVGVGDESAEEGEDADRTEEVGGSGGGVGDAHVHLAMQVAHHVQQHRDVSNVRHHNKDCKHI